MFCQNPAVTMSTSLFTAAQLEAPARERRIRHQAAGSRRTAENLGVVDRIDPVQAAREHVGAVVATTAAVRRDRRTDAKNAERNGDSTRDKSYLVRPPAAHSAGASAAGFALRRPRA